MKLLWRKAILSLEAKVDPVQNPLPSKWASQKQKQRSDDDMRSTINAVKGGENILRAAKLYNIPQQTLQDRISG